jgi:hypothetical protein
LRLRRQWSHDVDTVNWTELADLLKPDLRLAARHNGADRLALDFSALRGDLVRDPEAGKELRRQVDAARARRVRD